MWSPQGQHECHFETGPTRNRVGPAVAAQALPLTNRLRSHPELLTVLSHLQPRHARPLGRSVPRAQLVTMSEDIFNCYNSGGRELRHSGWSRVTAPHPQCTA